MYAQSTEAEQAAILLAKRLADNGIDCGSDYCVNPGDCQKHDGDAPAGPTFEEITAAALALGDSPSVAALRTAVRLLDAITDEAIVAALGDYRYHLGRMVERIDAGAL